jgi:hypothetical protein
MHGCDHHRFDTRIDKVLPGREKPRIRAAGADLQPHLFRAPGTVAFVRRLIAVDVDSRVHVATDEVHADEPAAGLLPRTVRITRRQIARDIETLACHKECFLCVALSIQSATADNFSI